MRKLACLAAVLAVLHCVSLAQSANHKKSIWRDDEDRSVSLTAGRGSVKTTLNTGATTRFSAAGDFSSTQNPNGTWSYGYTPSVGGPFALFTISGSTFFSGEVGWFGPIPGATAPGFPLVVATPNGPPQVLDMGPGPSSYSAVRWTAPGRGRWDVVGEFFGTGLTTGDVHVLRNSKPVFDSPLNASDVAPFSLVVRARTGDTVDFAAGPGPGGNNDFDSTGFFATVSPHRYDFSTIDFPGATQTQALGINERGDVVGAYDDANGNTHGFLLSHGSFTSIDFPGAVLTQARGINDKGDIVGLFDESSTQPSGFEHGFVLRKGHFTQVDFPGAADTDLLGLNEQGDFAGAYDLGDITTSIGFFTRHDAFTSFEVPGSAPLSTGAFGINDRKQIVGIFTDSADPNVAHGFLRDHGAFTTLDFPGADLTLTTGINERGDIVGNCVCIDGANHGLLLAKGNFAIVDFPIVDSRTRLRGINDRGQIVGFYRPGGGAIHAFIANPAQ